MSATAAESTLRYAETMRDSLRIHDAKASNLCTDVPRTRHTPIFTEARLRDLMALPFESNSIVNQ